MYRHLMVDTEGAFEEVSQRSDGQRGKDRYIDLIGLELRQHNVSMGALPETKQFSDEVYEVYCWLQVSTDHQSP